jgi:hypothetical protein
VGEAAVLTSGHRLGGGLPLVIVRHPGRLLRRVTRLSFRQGVCPVRAPRRLLRLCLRSPRTGCFRHHLCMCVRRHPCCGSFTKCFCLACLSLCYSCTMAPAAPRRRRYGRRLTPQFPSRHT